MLLLPGDKLFLARVVPERNRVLSFVHQLAGAGLYGNSRNGHLHRCFGAGFFGVDDDEPGCGVRHGLDYTDHGRSGSVVKWRKRVEGGETPFQ